MDIEIVNSGRIPDLEKRGFWRLYCQANSKDDLPKCREDYKKFHDVIFASLPNGKYAIFIRGATYSKEYLLSNGFQPWEGYEKGESPNTTELLDKLVEIRGQFCILVCEEDKKVYMKKV